MISTSSWFSSSCHSSMACLSMSRCACSRAMRCSLSEAAGSLAMASSRRTRSMTRSVFMSIGLLSFCQYRRGPKLFRSVKSSIACRREDSHSPLTPSASIMATLPAGSRFPLVTLSLVVGGGRARLRSNTWFFPFASGVRLAFCLADNPIISQYCDIFCWFFDHEVRKCMAASGGHAHRQRVRMIAVHIIRKTMVLVMVKTMVLDDMMPALSLHSQVMGPPTSRPCQ